MSGDAQDPAARVRRAPPPLRTVTVRTTEAIGPRLRRVTVAGPALVGFPVPLPAASVRLLVPSPGSDALVLPEWTGNEFLLPDGRRPALRTLTPRRVDPDTGEIDVDVVLHGAGVLSAWAAAAVPGAACAVSGPGRGYAIDADAHAFLLVGDESAVPAITQLLEALPCAAAVRVHVEVGAPEGRTTLPAHPGATVTWHDLADPGDPGAAMVAAVRAETIGADDRIWVAGEAASVQRIRRHLFEERGVPRARATFRGYWKRGRLGDEGDA
ncbi:MAG: siderophore-interacting protein [Actinomycetota bacterium]